MRQAKSYRRTEAKYKEKEKKKQNGKNKETKNHKQTTHLGACLCHGVYRHGHWQLGGGYGLGGY